MSFVKNGKGLGNDEAKRIFLDFFNDDEILIILGKLHPNDQDLLPRDWATKKRLDIKMFVRTNVGKNNIYVKLHFLTFNTTTWNGNHASVIAEFDKIRDSVRKLIKPPTCPDIPNGFTISNKYMRDVSVTIHAWQRFFDRFLVPHEKRVTVDLMKKRMQISFARAEEVELPSAIVTKRLIDSGFKRARYFTDEQSILRFVVSEVPPYSILTIERPL